MNALDSDSRGRPTQHRLPQNQPKYGSMGFPITEFLCLFWNCEGFCDGRLIVSLWFIFCRNYGPNAMNRWHKVRLRNTKDKGYQKEDIVRFFSEALDTKFHAINYVAEETSILFWVQGDPLAGMQKSES